MSGYLIYRSCWAIVALTFFVLFAWLLCVATITGELSREAKVRERVGPGWEAAYESDYGSLTKERTKVGIAGVGIIAIPATAAWLIRVLRPKENSGRTREHSRSGVRHWFRSRFGGFRYYRRNGTVAIALGVFGILVSVFLAVFRVGIFEHHSDEVLLGIAVFLPAYGCVLTGCRWWLKAKEQNDALIFIGMMPLAVLFIPYVRLVFVAAPMLLPVAMVMMPLVLVVVVLVLPDKGRPSRRRARWDYDER